MLVSSAWRGRVNVMTMNWHAMMESTPTLIGCVIAKTNCSFELIRRSSQCVGNLPTVEMLDVAAGIGNCSGSEVDRFARFGLTPHQASQVEAPLIDECHPNFECRLHDRRLVKDCNYFIFECVKAPIPPHAVPARPSLTETGNGDRDPRAGVMELSGGIMAGSPRKVAKKRSAASQSKPHRWSSRVTRESDALDLEKSAFTLKDPYRIAALLKRSAQKSRRRKVGAYRSAMSMLTFYVADGNLPQAQRKILDRAKEELRAEFGRV